MEHIPTAQAGAAQVLAWEENTALFHPLQLREERETVEGCFKSSQKEKDTEKSCSISFLRHGYNTPTQSSNLPS